MFKYLVISSLSLLLSLISCTPKTDTSIDGNDDVIINPKYGSLQDSENVPIQFELIQTLEFPDTDSLLISGFGYLKTDSNGSMYFFDRQQSKLISTSDDGKLRWATGQKGRGPRDFDNFSGMLLRENQILTFNLGGTRIDIYDFDGNYIKTIGIDDDIKSIYPLGFSSNGLLVGNTSPTGMIGTTIKIAELKEDAVTLISEFDINQAESMDAPKNTGMSTRVNFVNDQIVSGNFEEYEILIFDLQGNLIKTISRDLKITRPGIGRRNGGTMVRSLGSLVAPKYLSTGHFFATAAWAPNITDPDNYAATGKPEAKFQNTLDFFAPDGELLYSFEKEGFGAEIGNIIHIDANDILYIPKTRESLTLNKYKLRFPE